MKEVNLEPYGLLNITIREDGLVWNHRTSTQCRPDARGMLSLSDGLGVTRRIMHRHLMECHFNGPWCQPMLQGECYASLWFMGYSSYLITESGRCYSLKSLVWLVGNMSFDSYHRYLMASDDGPTRTEIAHRLVARAFIPNPDGKTEVNHKDGNKLNNHVSNLEWVWAYENMDHALKRGLRHSAISDDQIHEICRRLQANERVVDIMAIMHIQKHHILGIKEGCHARISKFYNIPRNKHFSDRSNSLGVKLVMA